MSAIKVHKFFLTIHLYAGLAVAVFLCVAGLTGAILAFQPDYDHWLHPSLWRVTPQPECLSEQALVARVEQFLADNHSNARIEQISLAGTGHTQVLALADGSSVFVNPYDGAILGIRHGRTRLEKILLGVRQLHIQLLAGSRGQWVVDIATMVILLLVPTGIYLWWNNKRLTVRWKSSWRRINWDLHNAAGIYGCLFVLVLSVTGLLIAFEEPLIRWFHPVLWRTERLPHSSMPDGAERTSSAPTLDQLLLAADQALPGAETYQVQMPLGPRSVLQVRKHGPNGFGSSTIYLDQYSGKVLRVEDFSRLPPAYRAHIINQAIHFGTILGLPTRILNSASSLALVTLVVTGTILWWK